MMAKLWGYLAGFGALIVGVVGFFFYAKRQGAKDEQSAETAKSLEQAKGANAIDDKVRSMSDADLDARLRSVQRKNGV